MKIAVGFKGERVAVLPHSFRELMEDNPLTGDLYVTSIRYISKAMYHFHSFEADPQEYLLLYCTVGKGYVGSSEFNYVISANQYIVVNANKPYTIRADENEPWTIYWITFRGEKAKIYASMMSRPLTIPPSIYSRIEQRTDIFEAIFNQFTSELSIGRLNYANILFANFLASFVYSDMFQSGEKSHTLSETMISRVTHYMAENIERSITLGELASYAGYSPSYFYRQFIKEIETPPIEYFIKMKINKASIYLIKTNMSISQISAKLGFNSADYFSRIFKKTVGLSASEFRAQGFRL